MDPIRPEHNAPPGERRTAPGDLDAADSGARRDRPKGTPGGGVRVLIVDDNALIRVALSGVIRQDGNLTVVGEAGNAKAALEAIRTAEPDLVCLDVLMPGMDGLTALRQIRQEHPNIRVVLITGQGTSDVVNEARSLGAHGFVVKPFSAARVLNAIRQAMLQAELQHRPADTDVDSEESVTVK